MWFGPVRRDALASHGECRLPATARAYTAPWTIARDRLGKTGYGTDGLKLSANDPEAQGARVN